MKAKHKPGHGGSDEERWLLTYSDMITLLLALFIVLFALSSINKAKFDEFRDSVRSVFMSGAQALAPGAVSLLSSTNLPQVPQPLVNPVHGPASPLTAKEPAEPTTTAPATKEPSPTTTISVPSSVFQTVPPPPSLQELQLLERKIRSGLAARGLLQDVAINLRPNDLSIALFADRTFFATNSNVLSSVGDEIVDTVGRAVAPHPNYIAVKGYADNVPVTGPPWYSNFMLSAARATAVVQRLTRYDDIAGYRLVAEGYGSFHPIASNATPAGRAKNRRVDIDIDALQQG
jgi:chemotaxis protein MotB